MRRYVVLGSMVAALALLVGCAVQMQAAGSLGRGQTRGTVAADGALMGETVATVRGVEILRALPLSFWALPQLLRYAPAQRPLEREQWLALASGDQVLERALLNEAAQWLAQNTTPTTLGNLQHEAARESQRSVSHDEDY